MKLDEEFKIGDHDSDPYVHHGDYTLIIAAEDTGCDVANVTLKLRKPSD